MTDETTFTRLMLAVADASSVEPRTLVAAIGGGDVASVLLRVPVEKPMDSKAIRALVEAIQRQEIAAVVEADVEFARAVGADGVHVPLGDSAAADVARARAALGKSAIVGVAARLERHDAMMLGELGVDYVAFPVGGPDEEPARQDLVGWWCEVIEVPAVALAVADIETAGTLARLGCDFIAVELPAGVDAAGAAAHVAAFQRAISRHPVVA